MQKTIDLFDLVLDCIVCLRLLSLTLLAAYQFVVLHSSHERRFELKSLAQVRTCLYVFGIYSIDCHCRRCGTTR